jgi:phosphinothricin acetyltransferase
MLHSFASPVVRPATEADLPSIQRIYSHHVLHGLASFEEEPPGVEEMLRRYRNIIAHHMPYLAAQMEGRVVGYCYAAPFRARTGYRFTLEDSVYVEYGNRGKGIGRALLAALLACCEGGPWRQMVAVIGDSANLASIRLHEAMGFQHVGTLRSVGFKLGRWVDSVYMQRSLGAGDGTLP